MCGTCGTVFLFHMTLATFEVVDFYRVNYEEAKHVAWRNKSGGKLLMEKYVKRGNSQHLFIFCTSGDEKTLFCYVRRKH